MKYYVHDHLFLCYYLYYKNKLPLWFTHKQYCSYLWYPFYACWFRDLLCYLLFSRNCVNCMAWINTLRLRLNEQHFADDIFKRIFFNENVWILIKISLKFVPKGPINNIPALVQIMAWRRSGNKPLSEPMMVSLPTHICVTQPRWVKRFFQISWDYNLPIPLNALMASFGHKSSLT